MKPDRFFRWSFALPLVVPLVALPLGLLSQVVAGTNEATELSRWSIFLSYSLGIGSVPYVVFAAAVLLWSRRWSAGAIRTFTLVAPPLFAAVFFVLWVPFVLLTDASPHALGAALTSGAYYAALCMGVGYAYVLLVHGLYGVLRLVGVVGPVIRPSAA